MTAIGDALAPGTIATRGLGRPPLCGGARRAPPGRCALPSSARWCELRTWCSAEACHGDAADERRRTEPQAAQTIQSVDRAALLIKAIADSRHRPTVVELADRLRPEPQHGVAAARDARRARPDRARPDQPALQPRLRVPAHRGGRGARPARAAARPVLERLARETGEATNLAVAKRFQPRLRRPGRPAADHGAELVRPRRAAACDLDRQGVPRVLTPEERASGAAGAARAVHARRRSPTGGRSTRSSPQVRRDGLRDLRRRARGVALRRFGAGAPPSRDARVAIVSVWGTEHRLPRERLDQVGSDARSRRRGRSLDALFDELRRRSSATVQSPSFA